MADEWQEVSFADICEHSAFGPRFSGSLYDANGNVATLRTTDIDEAGRIEYSTMPRARLDLSRLHNHVLREDDLVITRTGRVGTAAVFCNHDLPVLPGAFLIRFRLRHEVAEPRFFRYFFNSPFGHGLVLSTATGSVQQNLNVTSLHRMTIPLPPLKDQRAIVHILGTLDDKIELNWRMNQTLEQIARAIFKSWFVDFDPVKRKAEGGRRKDERVRGQIHPTSFTLDPSVAALFPASFTDSPLGPVPNGWAVGKLSELCSTQYGYTASATEKPVGPKLLRVTDINKRNWIEWDQVPYCEIDTEAKPKYALSMGDILVARMADPGKSAIVEEDIGAVFASYLVRLTTPSLAHAYFVFGFLKSQAYREYSEGARGGSVQANMNARVIVGADMVLPPEPVLNAFLDRVLPLRRGIAVNVRESAILAAIRDALLPKLLSGEIRIGQRCKPMRDTV